MNTKHPKNGTLGKKKDFFQSSKSEFQFSKKVELDKSN